MAYEVVYEKGRGRRRRKKRGCRRALMTLAFFLVFLLLVRTYWPEGQAVLRQFLFPGDSEAVISALHCFAQELKEGIVFPDAWEAFCQEVTKGASH